MPDERRRRQANEREIPGTRMHLISIVIDCRPNNFRERLEILVERLDREPLRPILVPLASHAADEFSSLRIVDTRQRLFAEDFV